MEAMKTMKKILRFILFSLWSIFEAIIKKPGENEGSQSQHKRPKKYPPDHGCYTLKVSLFNMQFDGASYERYRLSMRKTALDWRKAKSFQFKSEQLLLLAIKFSNTSDLPLSQRLFNVLICIQTSLSALR